MTDALIRTTGIGKAYGGRVALKPLEWEVAEGSITGVLGPNGAGKTTLAKLIMGITEPTTGTVSVLGREVGEGAEAARSVIGFLPEDKLLYDEMKVSEFLRFYGSFFPDWEPEAVGTLLGQWGIPREPSIKELSKGNRAKLVLAAVICRRPRILLLDEPTIDLDPASAEEVLSLVARWAAGEGRAVVITTHRLEEVERICDRILVLHDGEALLQDDLDDLRDRWKMIRATGSDVELSVVEGWPGVRRVEGGAGWLGVIVEEGAEEVARRFREAGAEVEIEGVSLREIYLALTNYQRGRLDEALESVV